MASSEVARAFGLAAEDRPGAIRHFNEHGWVVVDAIEPTIAAALPRWVDEIASLPDGTDGILQHFERTDSGPVLCRSEDFVPVHAGLRGLLCEGPLVEVAGGLLGEPAVLYKEKINYKLQGGAGYSPHQDAPRVPDDRRARLGDGRDRRRRRVQRWPRTGVGLLRHGVPARQARVHPTVDRRASRLAARALARGTHVVVPQPHAASQRCQPFESTPPSAVPDLQRGARGRLAQCVLRDEARRIRREGAGDRARVSLIGDFEGRPV